jgi:hypothetical protein
MPSFPRAELEEMVHRWLAANRQCEAAGDWRPLADWYTEDATYGWNMGPGADFMAVGRAEIRDIAVGLEMQGLHGWRYPYQRVLIDDRQGEVIGLWKQVSGQLRPDGAAYEVAGIGGSWFRYGGGMRWSWQRDFFDLGNVASLFLEMMQAGALPDGMKKRFETAMSGEPQPGHYPRGTAPVPLW